MDEKFYITTAITYTSGKPHIGNTYEIILTDAIARYKKARGYDVYFMTGTDEHGQKVELKAADMGVTPKEFVDGVSDEIKSLWQVAGIDYDHFIRTTDESHEREVRKIFRKFYEQGDIYKSSYEGLYCTPCESFWTESQLVDGKCPDCGREVKPAKEEAYFFRMGKYAGDLCKHILTHPEFIKPASRKNEMMNNFLLPDEYVGKSDADILAAIDAGTFESKLQDLCVSRTTFKWGIPVDFDEKHVVYVWLDALTNYITGIGYDVDEPSENYKKLWPADVHVIGKDIVRFHTIYWPIFLMALGEPLPKCVFGHPWLLQGGEKMSKSRGNVMYVDDLAEVFGRDSVRFFVLYKMPYADDGVITWELLTEVHNSELANTLGNLVKRSITMSNKYFPDGLRRGGAEEDVDRDLISSVLDSVKCAGTCMDEYRVADAIDAVWSVFRRANKYIDETAPWILDRDPAKRERLGTVLYNLVEAISIGASMAYPFIPDTAEKIISELGTKRRSYDECGVFGFTPEYIPTKSPSTIFERLKAEDVAAAAEKISAMQKEKNASEPETKTKDVPMITIDDFAKIRMQVGLVVACEPVKKSKLLHETIKVGDRTLSVLSGIANCYTADEMVGKKVVVVTNLPPREMKGIVSEGMIVCAEAPDGTLTVVSPEKDVPDGSVLG
ncbi:MAG: class I tRNA ligase family protein [Clostridia bacterium]|nr:class I tRNA ligase family protein [Clostridia bacterium]